MMAKDKRMEVGGIWAEAWEHSVEGSEEDGSLPDSCGK